jgi:hypothetical protein
MMNHRNPESASTPISKGGWCYNPDDPQDQADFRRYTTTDLAALARLRPDFDMTRHPAYVKPPTPIRTRRQLTELARGLKVRLDWHEPDEQDVTATVGGNSFDNAMSPGQEYAPGHAEMFVTLHQRGQSVAVINLAMLFAWATGYGDD